MQYPKEESVALKGWIVFLPLQEESVSRIGLIMYRSLVTVAFKRKDSTQNTEIIFRALGVAGKQKTYIVALGICP